MPVVRPFILSLGAAFTALDLDVVPIADGWKDWISPKKQNVNEFISGEDFRKKMAEEEEKLIEKRKKVQENAVPKDADKIKDYDTPEGRKKQKELDDFYDKLIEEDNKVMAEKDAEWNSWSEE